MIVAALFLAGCIDPGVTKEQQAAKARSAQKGIVESETLSIPELPKAPRWQALPDASIPRAEHCATNLGPKFIITGGLIVPSPMSLPGPAGSVPAAVPTAITEIFDASRNAWSRGTDFPANIDHCLAVTVGDTAYFIAGGNSRKTKDGMTWETLPAPPNSHGATGVAEEMDGKIFVTAGSGSGSGAVDVYDPATNTWLSYPEASNIPTIRNHMGGASVNGRLYAVGGDVRGHSVNTGANEEFDPVTGLWANRTALPVVRGSLHAFSWFGHLIVMGGQNGQTNVEAFPDVNAYDPLTDTWTELPPMSNPRHGFAGGIWEDKIYVFAGAPQQGVSSFANADVLVPG